MAPANVKKYFLKKKSRSQSFSYIKKCSKLKTRFPKAYRFGEINSTYGKKIADATLMPAPFM